MESEGAGLLAELGFELSAELTWDEPPAGIELRVFSHSREKGVYAMVVEDEVVYVGQTGLEFYRRIYFYRNPGPSQQTNLRINQLLVEFLPSTSSRKCEVWFLSDEHIQRGKLTLALGRSSIEIAPDRSIFERILIGLFEPRWNRG